MPSIKKITKLIAWVAIVMLAYGPLGVLQQTPVAYAQSPAAALGIPQGQINTPGGTGATVSNTCSGITGCIAYVVYLPTVGLSSYIASWAADFFNYLTKLSLQSTAYALDFLTASWTIVLNLANMFFIFILIYLAFTIMLKAESTRTMQTLAWVIAIALIVNFSFFITRTVIDAGNIMAVQFYNVIVSIPGTQTTSGSPDLSQPIMAAIGVDQLLGKGFTSFAQQVGSSWGALLIACVVFISTGIMLLILAWSFFMIGIKFLIRIVGLWLILIASPVAFVAKTLNQTKRFFDMWLQALVSLSFYPAVFLLMFYMLLLLTKQISTIAGLGGGNNFAGTLLNAQGTMQGTNLTNLIATTSVTMALMVGVLYLMLKVTDWIMKETGGIASVMLDRAGTAVAGATFRTAATTGAFAGRNVAGRLAYRAAENTTFKNFAGSSAIGNALWRGTSRLSKATYDVRNTPGGSILRRGAALAGLNIDTGKATTKSFTKSVENREKEVKKRGEELKGSDVEKRDAQEAYIKEYGKERYDSRIEQLQQKAENARNRGDTKEQKTAQDEIKTLQTEGAKRVEQAQKQRLTALANRIGSRNFRNLGMPSFGSIKGAAGVQKLAGDKSVADKFKDLAKEAVKEEESAAVAPTPTSTTGGAAAPAASPGGHAPGAGPSAFTREAGTEHALKEFTETMHRDLKDLKREQHSATEALQHLSRPEQHRGPELNAKKIVEQVSGDVAKRLQENAEIPRDTSQLKNDKNPLTGTNNLKQNPPEDPEKKNPQ